MKKFLLIASLILSSITIAFAQADNQEGDFKQQEKIQALYVAYVTKQLELTPDEAQKFWPMHTQFTKEVNGINKALPELDKQQKTLDIKRKYQSNFSNVLGTQRCERFFRLNEAFREKLIERVKKQRANVQRPKVRRGE